MSAPGPVAKTLEACSTPSPQKAAVFNVAEYKRQMALKQSPPSAKKESSSSASSAAAAPKKQEANTAKSAAAAAAPAANTGDDVAVVELANPGNPIMKVEARYDFTGNASKQEMSFEKGDYISVYGKSKLEGWWVGRAQGSKETLLFPFNYVKFVKKF